MLFCSKHLILYIWFSLPFNNSCVCLNWSLGTHDSVKVNSSLLRLKGLNAQNAYIRGQPLLLPSCNILSWHTCTHILGSHTCLSQLLDSVGSILFRWLSLYRCWVSSLLFLVKCWACFWFPSYRLRRPRLPLTCPWLSWFFWQIILRFQTDFYPPSSF